MKYLYLFAALFGGLSTASGQLTLTSFVAPYSDVANGQFAINESWDDPEYTVPLGFDYTFDGATTSSLTASEFFLGGILALDVSGSVWDIMVANTMDLTDAGYATGEYLSPITYETTGEVGNRIFKLQWKDVALYEEVFAVEIPANLFNMQLWVYETGPFEVRFGPNTIKDPSFFNADFFSCGFVSDIDIFGDSFGTAYLATGDAANPELIVGTSEEELFNALLLGIPENGRVYRFAPTGFVNVAEATRTAFEVWPLTAQHTLNLRASADAQTHYEFHDLSGRIVNSGQFIGQEILPVSHLAQGIYLVTLRSGDQVKTFKITRKQ
jgi:hypothetical protein